ncbi:MAG: hypothetical protein IT444_12175 [Phycisphaeraceae bacterium]|nr:hypothetical protein [Phycisphaeraceae bacterium]
MSDREKMLTPPNPMNQTATNAMYPCDRAARFTPWLCILATLAVALIDRFTPNLNLSILYSVPLVLYVLLSDRPVPWWVVLTVVLLTFAGYFTKPPDGVDPSDWRGRLMHLRMINRAMVAVVAVILGLLSGHFADLRRAIDPAPRSASVDIDDEVTRLLQHFLVMLASVIVMAGIFISDILVPPRINMPILYAVPIILSFRAMSRRLLWQLTPFALLLPFVSYFWDFHTIAPDRRVWSLVNRLIASGAVLLIALALDWWLRVRRRRTAPSRISES